MAGASNIEWTDATWNPIVGCSIVSPGCTNCYAMKMAARIEKMSAHPMAEHVKVQTHYAGTSQSSKAGAVWTGKVALAPEHILTAPLRWKKPHMIFVNSMGDLFHESIPDEWILRVLDVIRRCSYDGGSNIGKIGRGQGEHTFQLLTKRAKRMSEFMPQLRFNQGAAHGACALYLADDGRRPVVMKNLWLGVSTERQHEADERIPLLLQTPAAVRFISAEPLLGPIDLNDIPWPKDRPTFPATDDISEGRTALRLIEGTKLDWIIAGGESGPGARPMHPDWARSLRDQCAAADVPYFFKQWGGWAPHQVVAGGDLGGDVRAGRVKIMHPTGQSDVEVFEATGGRSTILGSVYMARVSKKSAGRLLDGKEHNEFPQAKEIAFE